MLAKRGRVLSVFYISIFLNIEPDKVSINLPEVLEFAEIIRSEYSKAQHIFAVTIAHPSLEHPTITTNTYTPAGDDKIFDSQGSR